MKISYISHLYDLDVKENECNPTTKPSIKENQLYEELKQMLFPFQTDSLDIHHRLLSLTSAGSGRISPPLPPFSFRFLPLQRTPFLSALGVFFAYFPCAVSLYNGFRYDTLSRSETNPVLSVLLPFPPPLRAVKPVDKITVLLSKLIYARFYIRIARIVHKPYFRLLR